MTDPLPAMLEVARDAARRAALLCEEVSGVGDPSGGDKHGTEPVTLADFGSQAVILGSIATHYPDHPVLAEEESSQLVELLGSEGVDAVTDFVGRATATPCDAEAVIRWIDHRGGADGLVWAVDPIDGTKGFLRGDQYAVAVGVLDGAEPVAGVLACPRLSVGGATGVLLWGGPGIGAFVEPLDGGPAEPTAVSAVSGPAEVRVLGSVEAAHGNDAVLQDLIDAAGFGGGWVRMDSQAKYAAVAIGLAELYLRPVSSPEWRERVWDHAAGAAILAGAGGHVTDIEGLPLGFGVGSTLEGSRGVVATNGHVHDLVLRGLRSVGT